jgi:Phage integrase family.
VYVPVTNHLQSLLDRYGSKVVKDAIVFPDILQGAATEKKKSALIDQFNKWASNGLKKACAELGIEYRPSMTYARHSFKTNLIMQGVPERYCEQAMGHADRSVSAHYVGMFSHDDRIKYNSMLL